MKFYFIPNRRFWALLTVFIMLLFVIAPVAAQDTTPAPVSPLLDVPAPDVVVNALVAAFYAIFAAVVASPVYSTIVSLVKRIPLPLVQNASADAINMFVIAVLVALVYGAQLLGVRDQLDTLFKVVLALAPIVVATAVGAKSSSVWYRQVVKGIPVLGTSRPERNAI